MLNSLIDYVHMKRLQHHDGDNLRRDSNTNMLPRVTEMTNFTLRQNYSMDHNISLQLTNWATKRPQEWTKNDVLDWIYYVVDEQQFDGSKFRGELYSGLVGRDLCRMDRRQFQRVDPCYGVTIFEKFQNLYKRASFQKSASGVGSSCHGTSTTEQYGIDTNNNMQVDWSCSGADLDADDCDLNGNIGHSNGLVVFQTDNGIKVDIPFLGVYTISPEIELPQINSSSQIELPQINSSSQIELPPKYSSSQIELRPINSSSQIPSFLSFSPRPDNSPTTPNLNSSPPSLATKSASQMSSKYPLVCSKPSGSSHKCRPWPQVQSQQSRTDNSCSESSTFMVREKPVLSYISESSLSSLGDMSSSPACPVDSYDPGYSSEDSTMAVTFMPPHEDLPLTDAFVNDIKDLGINDMPNFGSLVSTCDKRSSAKYKKVKGSSAKTGILLWKFVLGLLHNPNANPKLLKWEDRDHGVFRIVQSELVAKLWGAEKNNPVMTYEKLSRAMRFCRERGYFESVPKTGRFPKKLCFMFGGKAQGWRD